MAASGRPQKGGAPRGSGASLRLEAVAVNHSAFPRPSTTHAARGAILRASGPRQAAPTGEGDRAGRQFAASSGAVRSPAPPRSPLRTSGRNSSTSVACYARRGREISGRPRELGIRRVREYGGGLGHEWRLGVRAAERRASFAARSAPGLAFSCADRTINPAHEGLSDCPSDSERRAEAGGPASVPLDASIGYAVAAGAFV